MFNITKEPTIELLRELQKDCYFRFQNPNRILTEDSKSWGMIYSSEKEAIEEGSDVLEGKSCVDSPEKLIDWSNYYDSKYYVVLAFKGEYNGTGHDGEDVVKYKETVEVLHLDRFLDLFRDEEGYLDKDIYNN